jgi:hypothetical protein
MARVEAAGAAMTGDGSVRDLQARAAAAARGGRRGLSRAARLLLIDQLSRWGGTGLACFAGAALFAAIAVATGAPVRSAVWLLLLFGALYVCRRYRTEFRRGHQIAARPFRWRSYYTASLAVVSAAFGAGAPLLVAAPDEGAARLLILMLAAASAAAAFNAAHRAAAAAAGLPAAIAVAAAAIGAFGASSFAILILAAALAAASGVLLLSAAAERRAGARFPRTALQRRRRRADPPPAATPMRAAARP